MSVGAGLGAGNPFSGENQRINPAGDLLADGRPAPEGWVVRPHGSIMGGPSEAEVERIIQQGIQEALQVRAQIRLPISSRTRMVLGVTDTTGEVLGLYRMPDATVFSIDVAVAKARNVSYYADAGAIQPQDLVDDNHDGVPDLPPGVAFSNRTFRFLAEPRFPSGVDGSRPGAFSILNDPGIHPGTAENVAGPTPFGAFQSVLGYDAFHPGTNFHDPQNIAHQNGIVFFPGSLPLYRTNLLVGGFGVSGDGVDQDDVVTWFGAQGFLPPPNVLRADQVFIRGVRLPILNFPRNPHG
jgi:uncharacterized protein GlcG (DUF336 family)